MLRLMRALMGQGWTSTAGVPHAPANRHPAFGGWPSEDNVGAWTAVCMIGGWARDATDVEFEERRGGRRI